MKIIAFRFFLFQVLILIFTFILKNFYPNYKKTIDALGTVFTLLGLIVSFLSFEPNYSFFCNSIGFVPEILPIECHYSAYNEGRYFGGWRDGMPQGTGTMEYGFFDDNEFYSIYMNGQEYKALKYTGEFNQKYRNGKGTVVYEGGYRDEGTFYGKWIEGNKVFEGKRWLTTENFNGYRELEMYAISGKKAEERWKGDWVSVPT